MSRRPPIPPPDPVDLAEDRATEAVRQSEAVGMAVEEAIIRSLATANESVDAAQAFAQRRVREAELVVERAIADIGRVVDLAQEIAQRQVMEAEVITARQVDEGMRAVAEAEAYAEERVRATE